MIRRCSSSDGGAGSPARSPSPPVTRALTSSPRAVTRRSWPGTYAGEPGISTETVDLSDEESIAALGKRLGAVHHVVSTASARARGRVADLDRDALRLSFDVKVLGPLMLAKHLAPRMGEGGSFVLFSGVAATKITVGTLGVAITNAAADTLARSLALELAPIRVNAISPGVIDSGAWDALGEEGKEKYYAEMTGPQPGPPDRHHRRRRQHRPVRDEQHLPHRADAAHRRRRAADLTGPPA